MEQSAQAIERFIQTFNNLHEEISKVIVGQKEVVEEVLVALFADGHVLLEGLPGLGKTLLVKSLGDALGLKFRRIQFTPDLMPADVVGTNLVIDTPQGKKFEFNPGPIFTNIILADEINRATPKTQSAFLEAMQERQVTVAGKTYKLDPPFFVLATQNPIEQEGTYNLPEAQIDRFLFKLLLYYVNFEDEKEIIRRTTGKEAYRIRKVISDENPGQLVESMKSLVREVLVSSEVEEYIVRLVFATRPAQFHKKSNSKPYAIPEATNKFISCGAGTRGCQSLALSGKVFALLDGRPNVSFDDVDRALYASLRHRLILNFEAEVEGKSPDEILEEIKREVKRFKK